MIGQFAAALAIGVTVGEPVLFRERRPGYNEIPFTGLKFRTMTNKRDENGKLLREHERMGPLWRFLRNTSLDELRRLCNILRCDLSCIGARPLYERYVLDYTPHERQRRFGLPGLTGWAQANGRRGLVRDERRF